MAKGIGQMQGALFAARGGPTLRVGLVAAALLAASASLAPAQVELKTYVKPNGYLNVRALTCAQLANTYQEDADLLGVWYSGWLNGRAKSHYIDVDRTKAGIHQVIVYCKANPDQKVVDAVKIVVNQVRANGQ
jgi:hypothetical protein